MAKPDKTDNPNKAGGRANAPGLDKEKDYVNDAGETVTVTKREWHETYKDQGYRAPEDDDGDETEEAPVVETPA
jgi:hypothetical protein